MATISKTGTNSTLIKYSGLTNLYINKDQLIDFHVDGLELHLCSSCGKSYKLSFDNQTELDAAVVVMLSYF